MDPVTLMSIAANLATLFSFGGDLFNLLSASLPSSYTREEIKVWRDMINSINSIESNILYDIKGDEHRRLISDLASERLKFDSLVTSLCGNDLTEKIDEFIIQFESKNFEFNFVNLLNSTFHGQKSFLQLTIERIKNFSAERKARGPPQKILYEIYLSLVEKIGEANTLHRFAIAKKSAMQGDSDNVNFKYIDSTLSRAVALLKTVFRSAFDNFKEIDDRICYPQPVDNNFVAKSSIIFQLHLTRVKVGYVVTGFRFVQEHNMVYLQLQSAKLMPLGLIDQSTIAWDEIDKTGHIEPVDALTSLTGSFVDHDIALTGVELFCNSAERLLSLRVIGRRFDFRSGQLGLEEISKNLTRNSTVRSAKFLSQASISLKAPLAAINIMNSEVTGHLTPVAVSLDYRQLLKLDVDPDMRSLNSGSAKAGKIRFVLFRLMIIQICLIL